MAKNKTPPKWAGPIFMVLTVIMGGVVVYRVVAGGDLFLPSLLFLVFAFNVWVNWHQRRKVADSPPE